MQVTPWHLRLPNAEQYQWYKNLLALEQLSLSWTGTLNLTSPQTFKGTLEATLQDALPHEWLIQFEQRLWKDQFEFVFDKQKINSGDSEKELLLKSFKEGAVYGQKSWPRFLKNPLKDVREALFALRESPFGGYPQPNPYLIRRSISRFVEVELLQCPHQKGAQLITPEAELSVKKGLDLLCRLHSQWISGYLSSLNPDIKVTHTLHSPRCLHAWALGVQG